MTGSNVLVVGGGMGGLTAALTALQNGATVTLVEKSGRPGGSAALSNGMLTTYGDLDRFRASAPDGDERLQELVHDTLPASAEWLRSMGVELQPLERQFDRYDGWHFSPGQLIAAASTAIRAGGGDICLDTALDQLATEDGSVVGAVVVDASSRSYVIEAERVVLATGGFQGSPELLARYALLDANWVVHRSNPWSTGDGLSAAVAVGAATTAGLGRFYGHALAAPPARQTAGTFADLSQYYGSRSVAVDMTGRRFIDETTGAFDENVNEALARRPGGLGFYVFDEDFGKQPLSTALPATPEVFATRAAEAGGVVVRGRTLDELAQGLAKHGVPRDVVRRTLEDYAAAMAAGHPERLDVPRTGEGTNLARGQFTAVRVQSGLTFTTGGIAVDEEMHVLRRSRSSAPRSASWITDPRDHATECIPGLFAVGSDIGGVSNGGYAGGLATALTTGRAAGLAAARP